MNEKVGVQINVTLEIKGYRKFKIDEKAGKDCFWGDDLKDIPDLVLCPVCGYEYNHLKDLPSHFGDWEGKGSVIKIPMSGECGHLWNVCFGFHKGNLYLYCEYIGDGA